MADGDKVLVVVFFRTENGREPVREWLVGFGRDDMRAIGTDLKTVEFGWPVGMPTCRALGDGLWETRTNLSDKRIARVFFCIRDGEMVLLHGFVKKTQKTPAADLEMARKRMRQLEGGNGRR